MMEDENISADKKIDNLNKVLQQNLETNEFINRQIDLFAAFIWRHQQKQEVNGNTNNDLLTIKSNPELTVDESNDVENGLVTVTLIR